jgi:hypothetical protein
MRIDSDTDHFPFVISHFSFVIRISFVIGILLVVGSSWHFYRAQQVALELESANDK